MTPTQITAAMKKNNAIEASVQKKESSFMKVSNAHTKKLEGIAASAVKENNAYATKKQKHAAEVAAMRAKKVATS